MIKSEKNNVLMLFYTNSRQIGKITLELSKTIINITTEGAKILM